VTSIARGVQTRSLGLALDGMGHALVREPLGEHLCVPVQRAEQGTALDTRCPEAPWPTGRLGS
jgi:hypothetical protein